MVNQQYYNLMYHLNYLESMLEVVADKVDSPETGGGGSAQFAGIIFTFICLMVNVSDQMHDALNAVHWKGTVPFGL